MNIACLRATCVSVCSLIVIHSCKRPSSRAVLQARESQKRPWSISQYCVHSRNVCSSSDPPRITGNLRVSARTTCRSLRWPPGFTILSSLVTNSCISRPQFVTNAIGRRWPPTLAFTLYQAICTSFYAALYCFLSSAQYRGGLISAIQVPCCGSFISDHVYECRSSYSFPAFQSSHGSQSGSAAMNSMNPRSLAGALEALCEALQKREARMVIRSDILKVEDWFGSKSIIGKSCWRAQ